MKRKGARKSGDAMMPPCGAKHHGRHHPAGCKLHSLYPIAQ